MKTSNLSHVTAASAVAHCITTQPSIPVVVHWQMPEFAIRIAKALVERKHSIVWVVATTERGDMAEQELTKVGITVKRGPAIASGAELIDDASLTDMQRLRLQLKNASKPKQFPPPGIGTITVVSIQGMGHHTPLSEIVHWESPLAVFDHIGAVNARWLKADLDTEDDDGANKHFIPARAENAHPIPVFLDHSLPMVFLTRDELEGALIRADFKRHSRATTQLVTKYKTPPKLSVSVIATDLVVSKYAAGAFLSIVACNPDVHVVGEALIGAVTPDKLSMSTITPLKRAVLKISRQHETFVELAVKQTGLPQSELLEMRIRDVIRTVVLSFDSNSRKPELAVFCPWDMAAKVQHTVGTSKRIRLSAWTSRPSVYEGKGDSAFVKGAVMAAQSFPIELGHGNRFARITSAIACVQEDVRPNRVARLALALHHAAAPDNSFDLAGRPEHFVGLSDRADRAVGLFNKILDATYPWSASAPREKNANLQGRLEVMRLYKEFWEERARGN